MTRYARYEKELIAFSKQQNKFRKLALDIDAPSSEIDDIALVMLICDTNIRETQSTSVKAFSEYDIEIMIRSLGESVYGRPPCPYVASWTDLRVKRVAAVIYRQLMRRTTRLMFIMQAVLIVIIGVIAHICGC
jgi:hypothetical protein